MGGGIAMLTRCCVQLQFTDSYGAIQSVHLRLRAQIVTLHLGQDAQLYGDPRQLHSRSYGATCVDDAGPDAERIYAARCVALRVRTTKRKREPMVLEYNTALVSPSEDDVYRRVGIAHRLDMNTFTAAEAEGVVGI